MAESSSARKAKVEINRDTIKERFEHVSPVFKRIERLAIVAENFAKETGLPLEETVDCMGPHLPSIVDWRLLSSKAKETVSYTRSIQ